MEKQRIQLQQAVNVWKPQNLFYRFEFQGRGTVHIHVLAWLKDLYKVRLPLMPAMSHGSTWTWHFA